MEHRLAVPVFTIGVGETEGFTDVRIAELGAPEFAFRGREVKARFDVQAYGMKGKTMPLYFNRGKNLITSRSISRRCRSLRAKDHLSFTPKEIGHPNFSVKIAGPAGANK